MPFHFYIKNKELGQTKLTVLMMKTCGEISWPLTFPQPK